MSDAKPWAWVVNPQVSTYRREPADGTGHEWVSVMLGAWHVCIVCWQTRKPKVWACPGPIVITEAPTDA